MVEELFHMAVWHEELYKFQVHSSSSFELCRHCMHV